MYDKTKLALVARRYHLDLIILFGSQAKGRARADSDIDVAVRASKPGWAGSRRVPFWKWQLDVIGQVGACFEGDADVSFLNQATPLFLYQVAISGILLYEKHAGDFIQFKLYATRIYEDNYKFFQSIERFVERRFGERTSKAAHPRKAGKSASVHRRARAAA